MFEKIGELPAHPLIVHMPIVFGPIVGLLTLGLLHPAWRERLIRPLAALSLVVSLFVIASVQSGEWLLDNLNGLSPTIKDHEEAAEQYRNASFLLTLGLLGAALVMRRLKGAVLTIAMAAIAVLGLVNVATVVRAGHEGATAAWDGRLDESDD